MAIPDAETEYGCIEGSRVLSPLSSYKSTMRRSVLTYGVLGTRSGVPIGELEALMELSRVGISPVALRIFAAICMRIACGGTLIFVSDSPSVCRAVLTIGSPTTRSWMMN
eukprot:439946-Rhodomonas_salina.2